MNLFDISNKGVAMGKTNAGTSTARRLEINYPAHFHIQTTLPNTVNYNPNWVDCTALIMNGADAPSGYQTLVAKKVGAHVYLKGQLQVNVAVVTDPSTIAILPVPLIPTYAGYFFAPIINTSNHARLACLRVLPEGFLQLYYAGLLSGTTTDPSNNKITTDTTGTFIVDFNIDYFANNSTPLTVDYIKPYPNTYLFDGGLVNGVEWTQNPNQGCGTLIPCYGQLTTGHTWPQTTLHLYTTTSSGVGYRRWSTAGPIWVPDGTTVMKVSSSKPGNSNMTDAAFGLLAEDETTAVTGLSNSNALPTFSGNHGSIATHITTLGSATTTSLSLGDSFDYSKRYYAFCIAAAKNTSSRQDINFNNIWFE